MTQIRRGVEKRYTGKKGKRRTDGRKEKLEDEGELKSHSNETPLLDLAVLANYRRLCLVTHQVQEIVWRRV